MKAANLSHCVLSKLEHNGYEWVTTRVGQGTLACPSKDAMICALLANNAIYKALSWARSAEK